MANVREIFNRPLMVIPVTIVGYLIRNGLYHRIPAHKFDRWVHGGLVVLGVALAIKSLFAMTRSGV